MQGENRIVRVMRHWRWGVRLLITFFVIMICVHTSRQEPLFSQPVSLVALAEDGNLLSARIAADGQWRFEEIDSVPRKFEECVTAFEDKRFRYHWGIDLLSTARAVVANIRAGHVVEGGSTLTMQLARMARGNQSRTIGQKIIEAAWAVDIEFSLSKDKILALYASHAPFGGNVVGIDAASWRYFGRNPYDLSWAESALLAVLPNAPARIHVARNRERLKAKRDRLLDTLFANGTISETEHELAKEEPLPDRPFAIENSAPQLMQRIASDNARKTDREAKATTKTTINQSLQRQVQTIADNYRQRYTSNHIYDIGILVADVETGHVMAYIGNATQKSPTSMVDMLSAERSTGSILKPFLFAAMMSGGETTPRNIVADTPLDLNGFTPENYSHSYSGAVHTDDAIIRSLNVPLVRMLTAHNIGRFMADLRQLGMTTLHYSDDHYGASLILGGAEATMWDLCGMYASMARRLNAYNAQTNHTDLSATECIHPLTLTDGPTPASPAIEPSATPLTPSAIWHTFRAMTNLSRPEEEADWQSFSSMTQVAWKTGTSFGSRDAWAIGVTPRHVVGVWVGNATGEGRAGMTGVGFAAPVMFDVFGLIERGGRCAWFEEPVEDEDPMDICRHSGMRASEACSVVDEILLPRQCAETPVCNYCRLVHLSPDSAWQVNSSCESVADMVTESRFILPPAMEYYYRQQHSDYKPLPPVRLDCDDASSKRIAIIYPEWGQTVVRTKNFNGELQGIVCQAVAPQNQRVYWHLDGTFIGETVNGHTMPIRPEVGSHKLAIVSESGQRVVVDFKVK